MRNHKTKNDVKSNAKSLSIELLNARVADGIDLALLTKQAHWNLKGPNFIAVHELLDMLRAHLDVHSDTVAERVMQLDGVALGTTQVVGDKTTLPAYPLDIKKVADHIGALVERYGAMAKSVREAIDAADDAGDADTADTFTAFSRDLDKDLWFLKSHLE